MSSISIYLSKRQVFLEHDREEVRKEMYRGCPRGSVLGLTLWNFTLDELLSKEFLFTVKPIAFADDFIIQDNLRRELEVAGKQICEEISSWKLSSKMTVAVNKTKGIILKGKLASRPSAIRLNNEPIQFVIPHLYLGMLLDYNLMFSASLVTEPRYLKAG